ncbi:DUF2867 domain-containing protein [Grimontia sp. NTOU-MAR1]|uniref:DUF2867 domain-containing protein n=1 Tax=Grimontia sp. NTOU-MAR1 TaxID=3111011 RepID=UPI002DBB8BA1|nr:DUF2867 domain-containing protein [Grimontia sp. NTOU-MAR1]WRV98615.1 DUF2867 domain-containing protein [Grimontia sp. NTOU-MAR1]
MDGIPSFTELFRYSDNAYFADNHSKEIGYQGESAMEIYLRVMNSAPDWVNALMKIRNEVVSRLGLKHLGNLDDFYPKKQADDYQVGDKVGIFQMIYKSHSEVIMEDRDKHLDVKLSFFVEPRGDKALVTASSVVHIKNTFGKVYMFFVGPVHKIIVPVTLRKL